MLADSDTITISVTFQKKDDKEMLMSGNGKKKLPAGIYVNEEFPLEI